MTPIGPSKVILPFPSPGVKSIMWSLSVKIAFINWSWKLKFYLYLSFNKEQLRHIISFLLNTISDHLYYCFTLYIYQQKITSRSIAIIYCFRSLMCTKNAEGRRPKIRTTLFFILCIRSGATIFRKDSFTSLIDCIWNNKNAVKSYSFAPGS